MKWKFDISTFRLLGRELITDRITALFELVKNSYDANANEVKVYFNDVNPHSDNSYIEIIDDGLGMTLTDIETKWMVIGAANKRANRISPSPYKRKLVGKKGVGRFAVDKLGNKLLLKTSTKNDEKIHFLEVDWSIYEKIESKQLDLFETPPDKKKNKLFTDIENKYWSVIKDSKNNFSGTVLKISSLRKPWTEDDIRRVFEELSKLVAPIKKYKYPLKIIVDTNIYAKYKNKVVQNNSINHATEEIKLDFNIEKGIQEVLVNKNGKLSIKQEEIKSFGPIKIHWFYFDKEGKSKFKKNSINKIDGFKIYRDGLIATPFAEFVADKNKQKDLLGLDKRRWSGFFDKISSRDVIGFIEITDKHNPEIKDATNRQGFVDSTEYDNFLKFFISQIETFEKYLEDNKSKGREKIRSELGVASSDFGNFAQAIRKIKKDAPPEVKTKLTQLESLSKDVDIKIKRGFDQFKKIEVEKERQKNLFLSLMSLQEYAAEIAHLVKTALARIIRLSKFISDEFPNPKYDKFFIEYSKEIHQEIVGLNKAVDFMLSYSRSNIGFEDINLKNIVIELTQNYYSEKARGFKIQFIIEFFEDFIIYHNKKFFEDIFSNLIDNSIKSLQRIKTKRQIKISGQMIDDKFIILFSDNGIGIPKEDWDKIFDVYFTTTAEEGGAGIGLFSVSKRIEALNGKIKVIENELKPKGATFRIELPIK